MWRLGGTPVQRACGRGKATRALAAARVVSEGQLAAVVQQAQCYPYCRQEWGKHSWDCAEAAPITAQDVVAATAQATAELDASFVRASFDRLSPSEGVICGPWRNLVRGRIVPGK